MQTSPNGKNFRVVVVGDSSVGKTSILNQLTEHTFNPYEQSTVGSNYQIFAEEVNNTRVEMQIWDTAGQERFRSLGPIYFRNAAAAVAVYDQTARASFAHLDRWIHDVTEIAGPSTIIVIAANKTDMDDLFEVPFAEAEAWAKSKGYIIMQTSAKHGIGIRQLFSRLAEEIVHNKVEIEEMQEAGKYHKSLAAPSDSKCC